jgi:hypothetical protein
MKPHAEIIVPLALGLGPTERSSGLVGAKQRLRRSR